MKPPRPFVPVLVLVAAALLVASWAWFAPSGAGESAASPDGRYVAHASNLRRGTWLHGRVRYVGVEVVERASGTTVWRAERYPRADELPPDFGDRRGTRIAWAVDSRSVTIPVGGPAEAVWLVP